MLRATSEASASTAVSAAAAAGTIHNVQHGGSNTANANVNAVRSRPAPYRGHNLRQLAVTPRSLRSVEIEAACRTQHAVYTLLPWTRSLHLKPSPDFGGVGRGGGAEGGGAVSSHGHEIEDLQDLDLSKLDIGGSLRKDMDSLPKGYSSGRPPSNNDYNSNTFVGNSLAASAAPSGGVLCFGSDGSVLWIEAVAAQVPDGCRVRAGPAGGAVASWGSDSAVTARPLQGTSKERKEKEEVPAYCNNLTLRRKASERARVLGFMQALRVQDLLERLPVSALAGITGVEAPACGHGLSWALGLPMLVQEMPPTDDTAGMTRVLRQRLRHRAEETRRAAASATATATADRPMQDGHDGLPSRLRLTLGHLPALPGFGPQGLGDADAGGVDYAAWDRWILDLEGGCKELGRREPNETFEKQPEPAARNRVLRSSRRCVDGALLRLVTEASCSSNRWSGGANNSTDTDVLQMVDWIQKMATGSPQDR